MDKWKKAVVHLECAADSVHFYDRIEKVQALWRDFEEDKITRKELLEEFNKGSRDIRWQGTAIFFVHKEKRYLVTARHVLWDEESAIREYQEEVKKTQGWQEQTRETLLQFRELMVKDNIYSAIFRVPSLE